MIDATPTRRRLRYIDPAARRGTLYRAFAGLASTRLATSLARTRVWGAIVWRVDRVLLRVTRGRVGTGLLLPTALLETQGARTGLTRRTAVIYFHDAERVTIVASKAGHAGDPAWFYNVRANPNVRLGGQEFRAEVVTDENECARLWELADRVLPAFAAYRRRAALAGRTIPIVQLVPRRAAE